MKIEAPRAARRRWRRLVQLVARVRGRAAPEGVGVRQGYDLWAKSYGDPPNTFQLLEAAAIEEVLPPLRGLSVVDLGCGRGRLAALSANRGAELAIGLDLSLPMLLRAEQPTNARFAAATLETLPLPSARFDLAIAALCLGHVSDLDCVLQEASRVLRPGGLLVASDFHPSAALRGMDRTFIDPSTGRLRAIEHHLHLLDDYLASLQRCGFSPAEVSEPRYEGSPMVLLLRARKEGEPSAPERK